MTQFGGHDSLKWLVVLLLGTAASAFGTLATNGVTVQRPHNPIRLWSECLANQQLTYVAFFFSLLAAFDLTEDYKNLCFLETFLCLIFFIVGMINIRRHGNFIAADHKPCPEECTHGLSRDTRWRLLGINTVLAIISLLLVLCLVLFLEGGRKSAPPTLARVTSGALGSYSGPAPSNPAASEQPQPQFPERSGAKLAKSSKVGRSSTSQDGTKNEQTVLQPSANVQQSGGRAGCTQNVIGGNNNTNNCAPPQRHVSEKQKLKLASIKVIINSLPVFCYNIDHEGCTYAGELRAALKDAGMDEGVMVGQYFSIPTDSDVYVAIRSKDQIPPSFEKLIEILQSAEVEPKGLIIGDVKEGEIRLQVGRTE